MPSSAGGVASSAFYAERLRLEQQPSVGAAWEEGNLPPIAVSFPHGLEKGFVGPFKVVGRGLEEAKPSEIIPGPVDEF